MDALPTDVTASDALCRRFHVRQLDLFGSAADGRFDPARNDLDFLVAFEELPGAVYADAYFGLQEGLVALFGRAVDLVTEPALENPYLRRRIEAQRQRVGLTHEITPVEQPRPKSASRLLNDPRRCPQANAL